MQATVWIWLVEWLFENFADSNPDTAGGPGEIGDVARAG
jgi:hypothetical protein